MAESDKELSEKLFYSVQPDPNVHSTGVFIGVRPVEGLSESITRNTNSRRQRTLLSMLHCVSAVHLREFGGPRQR
ncbi:unnamed protein product [Sphagnum balticum]